MDLHNQLRELKNHSSILPREKKLGQTVDACQTLCFCQAQERMMKGWEFLWSQFCHTRKRWWLLQMGLLLLAEWILPFMEDNHYRVRSVGVIGCLFVVLMIPELWRNRESASTQVEAACLYSLRQMYAARITLFGIVDVALLTLFSMSLGRMGLTMTEVVAQFLLPVTVTACICFEMLCGKSGFGETISLSACLIWSGVWWLVLMNERLYLQIIPSVWAALFAAALAFLALTVRRTLCTTNQYWEVIHT